MNHIEKALSRARELRAIRGGEAAGNSTTMTVEGITPEYTQIAVIPVADRDSPTKLVANRPWHPASDVYRLLRIQVLQRLSRSEKTTLAVTSARSGEGKTLTAINLALSIAMDVNQTVLLVDLNFRSPGIHQEFQFEPKAGLNDYLSGKATLNDCLVNPDIPRLLLLPARGHATNSAELLTSPRMTALARDLKQRHRNRLIIYDTPPLLSSGDTLGFLPNVDTALFVIRDRVTTRSDIQRSAELLSDHHVIGTMVNAVS
jgi:Mrp family chromosome partitioning ATPase